LKRVRRDLDEIRRGKRLGVSDVDGSLDKWIFQSMTDRGSKVRHVDAAASVADPRERKWYATSDQPEQS
jgi:hypothetical protein